MVTVRITESIKLVENGVDIHHRSCHIAHLFSFPRINSLLASANGTQISD